MVKRVTLALVAFVLAAPAAAQAASSRLRIVDLRTGAVIAQAKARSWSHLVWQPDGTLAATRERESVVAVPTGTIAKVRRAWATSLSPAGDRLATLVPAGDDERLEIRTVAGKLLGRRRVRGTRTGLAWSRDGKRLALAWADHGRGHHITILGPRGTALRTVRVPETAEFSSAGWAPDRRSLAFVSGPVPLTGKPREIRRLDLVTGRQSVLLRGTRCGPAGPISVCELLDAPAVSPDGGRVAVVRDLNAVTLLDAVAGPVELKLTQHQDGVFDVAWEPGGAGLIAAYVEAGSMCLAQLQLGGAARVIADLGHTSVSGLTISPDGTRAAFSGTSDIDF